MIVWTLESSESVLGSTLASQVTLRRAEHERYTTMKSGIGRDYLAAHMAARMCMAKLLDVSIASVEMVPSCPRCGSNDHGPLILSNSNEAAYVSISHASGLVAAVASRNIVGIDIEPSNLAVDWRTLESSTLTESESLSVSASNDPNGSFLRYWVRKEAAIKCGFISLGEMRELDLSHCSTIPGLHQLERYRATLLDLDSSGYIGAILCTVPHLTLKDFQKLSLTGPGDLVSSGIS